MPQVAASAMPRRRGVNVGSLHGAPSAGTVRNAGFLTLKAVNRTEFTHKESG